MPSFYALRWIFTPKKASQTFGAESKWVYEIDPRSHCNYLGLQRAQNPPTQDVGQIAPRELFLLNFRIDICTDFKQLLKN